MLKSRKQEAANFVVIEGTILNRKAISIRPQDGNCRKLHISRRVTRSNSGDKKKHRTTSSVNSRRNIRGVDSWWHVWPLYSPRICLTCFSPWVFSNNFSKHFMLSLDIFCISTWNFKSIINQTPFKISHKPSFN